MADAAQPADPTPIEPSARRPRGRARRWPGAKLTEMSDITASDIEKAAAEWRAIAPSRYKTLLDAHA